MAKFTADELARDILARQGVQADRGPSVGANTTRGQTDWLFSLVSAERGPDAIQSTYGIRRTHGDGWVLTEAKFGRGVLVMDTRPAKAAPSPCPLPTMVTAIALYSDHLPTYTQEAIQARLEAARVALAARRSTDSNTPKGA